MGLDNGIFIKKIKKEDIPYFVKYESFTTSEGEEHIELCYWRKCWGLRNEIIAKLHGEDNYEFTLDSEDVSAIIKIIKKFMEKEYWDDNADSIWDYDEMSDNLVQSYINLFWLVDYMNENKDIEVLFYDSY